MIHRLTHFPKLKVIFIASSKYINALRDIFSAASLFVYLLASFPVPFCDPLYSVDVQMDNNIVTYMCIYRHQNELESKAREEGAALPRHCYTQS